jgi:hypothetical protein
MDATFLSVSARTEFVKNAADVLHGLAAGFSYEA